PERESRESRESAFVGQRQVGDVVKGRVQRVEAFGAFIEVAAGVEGLAHVSELSWTRVEDPNTVVKVGDEVQVKILKMEAHEGRMRISLSIKQVGGHPWDQLPATVSAGAVVTGKVTRTAKFGAFVEVAPGVEGLIPLSEMSYMKRVMRAEECVTLGETVNVKVISVDPAGRRISLSLKDAGADPWALAAEKYPVGSVVKGKVEKREVFGLFIRLEEGVTGLMPKSKALEDAEFPFDRIKVGAEVSVQVAEIQLSARRMTLQPPKDPESDDWKSHVAPRGASLGGFGTLGAAFAKAGGTAKGKTGKGK
ncbi:MAG: S1 RNA-binding domain-containing protein, partial [Bdellovibrionales bacterium]|nr:S1 RNA-binding domain-containing protein [Bdellovibrionales bacterium]